MEQRRVVITGLGLVSPVGNDVETGWANILAGRSGIGPITRFDCSTFPTKIAGEVRGFEAAEWMPSKEARHFDAFIHYGKENRQVHGAVETDGTQWHNWAVEWTPSSITTYLDGRGWYRTADAAVQPPGPMHLCIQLDWFPKGGAVQRSTMQVDWVREYAVDPGAAPVG